MKNVRRRRCGRPASAPFAGTVQAPAVVWACFLVAPPTTVSKTAGFSGVPFLACAVSRLPATLRAAEPPFRRDLRISRRFGERGIVVGSAPPRAVQPHHAERAFP